MRFQSLSLLAALSSVALANIEFTAPAAGSSQAAGTVTVTWEDDGTSPDIDLLTTYTLYLMVGGNDASTMLQLWASDSTDDVSTLSTTAAITAGLAGDSTNGYFFKMLAVASEGGTVTVYSDRFSMTGMTGTTPAVYADAVTALDGSTAGPADVDDITTAAAAGAANEATVPYAEQTGLTKYAPMQSVPSTKITAKTYSPLYSTSAYTLATTAMATPTIVTTITASQTFSVSSMENTAAAAAQPSDDGSDMAKFLRRWKD